jgi:type II secretory pathway pseudopilin PulG
MKTYQVITPASTYPVSLTEAKSHLKVDTTADDTYIESIIKAATQLSEEYTNRFFIDTVIEQYASSFAELETLFKSKVSAVSYVKYYPSGTTTIPSSVTLTNAGSGYANGFTYDVATTGGTGSGLIVDIKGASNEVTTVTINTPGSGYSLNDVITITGGDGNATFTISSLGNTENQVILDSSIYDTQLNYEPSQIQLADSKSFPDITKRNDAVLARYTVGYGSAASDVPEIIKQAILLTIGNFYQNRNSVVIGRISTELPLNVKWLLDTYKVQIIG